MRQPSLFNFKLNDQLRNNTFTVEEERELIRFCLSDNYPRQHTVKRTGTTYTLKTPEGARALLKALRYGDAGTRKAITSPNQLSL